MPSQHNIIIYNITDIFQNYFRINTRQLVLPSDHYKWNYHLDASTTNTGVVLELIRDNSSTISETIIITSLPFHKFDSTIKKELKETDGAEDAFVLKMRYVRDTLQELIKRFPPEHVYIEGGFVQPKFLHSSAITLKLHGFLVAELMDYGITYIPPKRAKKIVTGNGNASKEDLQKVLIKKYTGNPNAILMNGLLFKNYDESDAFALWECVHDGYSK